MVPYFAFSHCAELGLRGPAIALLHVPLVPHVVAQGGGLIAIALDQGGQKLPRLRQDVVIIQTKRRAAGRAAAANRGKALGAVAVDVARVRIFVPHPLRRAIDDFGDDHLDVVLAFEFHHPVVIAPVVPARRVLDRRPHEPVAEDVDSHLSRGLVVAFPILLRRIRFAEIHRAKREHRIGKSILLRLDARRQCQGGDNRPAQANWIRFMASQTLPNLVAKNSTSSRTESAAR